MTKKEYQLEMKIAQMEADIKVTSLAFGGLLKCLGLDLDDFKGMDEKAIKRKTPAIAKNISKALISGGDSFGDRLDKAIAVGPVMAKYAYLFTEEENKSI